MRERKGEAMRVRKEPTQKRRGGGIRFKSIISAGVKRALKVGAALIASVAMLTAGTAFAVDELDRIADGDTRNTYTESFGTTNSTRYAGRIWTDKSVSADGSVTFDDGDGGANPITINKYESDFLVTYSAMATSQIITGQAPTDTVFILDLSASMTWGYSKPQEAASKEESRLYAMVNAVNSAIDELVKSNPQNRIAIVAFSGNLPETQLLPALTTGEELQKKVTNGEYLSLADWKPGEDSDLDDTSANVVCNYNENVVGTAGGTNIQAGLFEGMSILTDDKLDTTYEVNGTTVTRIPNVVLMSDGAPTTFSSAADAEYKEYRDSDEDGVIQCTEPYWTKTIYGKISDRGISGTPVCRNRATPVYSGSWWDTNSGLQIGAGDNDNPDSADGVMALLTAAYFKDRITAKYYGENNGENQANVYTVGFATSVQNNEMAMMANIVLNPAEYLDAAREFNSADNTADGADEHTRQTNNAQIRQVPGAIDQYLSGQDQDAVMQGSIGDGGNEDQITFVVRQKDHPEQDLTSVYYPTQAFSADDDESLNNALSQIVGLITEHAKAPTQVNPGENPAQSGYITYVDPIGEYMHVDSVKSLIWAGKQFVADNQPEANGTTTYTFHAVGDNDDTAIDSPVYGQHSVNDIIVTTYNVPAADGVPAHQELKVQIPANSIPLHVNTVTLDGNGNPTSNKPNNALPLRLVYGVSLNDDILNENGVLNTSSDVGSEYIEKHPGDTTGSVSFYTNLYSGKQFSGNDLVNGNGTTVGDANVTFQPADDNPFYFVQDNIPLRVGGSYDSTNQILYDSEPAKEFNANATYYFPITFYENKDEVTKWVARLGSQLQNYVKNTGVDGQLEIQKGSPRLGNLTDLSRPKATDGNSTGTAAQRLYPTFEAIDGNSDPHSGQFRVYLGNNGRLQVPTVQPKTLTEYLLC